MTTQIIDIKNLFKKNLNIQNKNVKIKKIINIINSNIEQSYIKYELENNKNIQKEKIKPKKQKKEIEKKNITDIIVDNYKINYPKKYSDFRDNIYNYFGITKIDNPIYKDIDLTLINFNNIDYFTKQINSLIINTFKSKFKHQLENSDINIIFKLTKFINLKYIPYDDMFIASYMYNINKKNGFLSIEFDINNNETENIFDNIIIKNIFDDFKLNFNIDKNKLTNTKYISNENNFFNIQKEYYQYLIDIY